MNLNGNLNVASLSAGVPAVPVVVQAVATTSLTTIATVPASKTWGNIVISISNITPVQATVTLHAVLSGNTASDSSKRLGDLAVAANSLVQLQLGAGGRNAGDFFQISSDTASAISVEITAYERDV
jgi:hypothetical protein